MSSLEEVVDLTGDDGFEYIVRPDSWIFDWEGKPTPLARSRKSWKSNRPYLPAATRKAKKEFVDEIASSLNHPTEPIYDKETPVVVEVRFYMPRPNYDFKGGKRGLWHRLKKSLPCCRPHAPDIDNLLKFVLDAMNGLVYADDRQVVKAVAYKLLDSSGYCNGRTELEVWAFDERIHMPHPGSRDHW